MMTVEEYLRLLLAGDGDACLAEAREIAVDLGGLHRLYVGLIAPSQYRVGELWEAGRISVAKEHLATATNSYVATNCHAALARATAGGPKGLVACTCGELHEFGARLLSDLLECDGWDVDFYGASLPPRDLVEAARERRPRFIGISAALTMHLAGVKQTISLIRAELADETPIVVGGNAFRGGGDLWRQVGADLYAPDASAAVELLRGLRDR